MEVRDVRELRDFAYRLVHPGGAVPLRWNAVFQKAGRTREKPDGKQNPAERR